MRLELDDRDVERIAARVVELLRDELRASRTDGGWLDSKAAAPYIGLTLNALHKLTSARQIPFSQDRPGGRCYFKCSDLDAWRQSQTHGPAL